MSKFNYIHETKQKYYTVRDAADILPLCVNVNDTLQSAKGVKYYNYPCAFDIETTSLYRDVESGKTFGYYDYIKLAKKDRETLEKIGFMYVWQFGINGVCFIGRTWAEFLQLIDEICGFLDLGKNRRLICYIHNLGFEFQFIRKLFKWENVFSIETRKPIYAISEIGLEFRCSYLLSGYSLDGVAKNLTKYKIKKLVGNLDYHLIRHEKTPLSDAEIDYCINDIKIIMLYILEYIEKVKNILHIPLTKTGAVRKFCRAKCFYFKDLETKKTRKNYRYKDLIKSLIINDLPEFRTINRAFCGGFTHANANFVDITLNDVSSFDFTSSYPYVMLSEKYPMSRGKKLNITSNSMFEKIVQNNDVLSVFDIEFTNIFALDTYENYISISKCFCKENFTDNNGRLVCAAKIVLTITNIDFLIIRKNYKWEKMRIGVFYYYTAKYLPTDFVKCIVELYKKKTELKGVDGMENEYLNSKEMLNSLYGMSVTNPLRDLIIYDNTTFWSEKIYTDAEKFDLLVKDNFNENRFLFYLWGVFVTAFARRNLWTAILELKKDYVYSDTDSVKFLNFERHKLYFETYNKIVENKLKAAADFHGIDFECFKPKTIKGVTKLIGVWDFEGVYKRFKTLGAKRYLVQKENVLSANGKKYDFALTVAGVNKFTATPYLLEKYGVDGIFNAFTNYLKIPSFASGKNILTYVDYETNFKCTDTDGNEIEVNCKSGVHFEPSEYNLNFTVNFIKYICGLRNNF